MSGKEQKAGDAFLDRYFADQPSELREQAREELRDFLDILLRIATRRAREAAAAEIRSKRHTEVHSAGGTSPPL